MDGKALGTFPFPFLYLQTRKLKESLARVATERQVCRRAWGVLLGDLVQLQDA